MLTVREEVERLLQQLFIAAGDNPLLELETTEIVPLARTEALRYENTIQANIPLAAQASVLKAMRELGARHRDTRQ